jgi:hypothetical protein
MKMYGVKRLSDGNWYGPGSYRAFGFDGLRISLFDTPGKAKRVTSGMSGVGEWAPENFSIMVVDLDQAVPYVAEKK